jgi:hypothetical protein
MQKHSRALRSLLLTTFLAVFVLLPGLATAKQSQPANVTPPPPSLEVFLSTLRAKPRAPHIPSEKIIGCAASRCPTGEYCYNCSGNYYCFYPSENGGGPPGCQGGGPL